MTILVQVTFDCCPAWIAFPNIHITLAEYSVHTSTVDSWKIQTYTIWINQKQSKKKKSCYEKSNKKKTLLYQLPVTSTCPSSPVGLQPPCSCNWERMKERGIRNNVIQKHKHYLKEAPLQLVWGMQPVYHGDKQAKKAKKPQTLNKYLHKNMTCFCFTSFLITSH